MKENTFQSIVKQEIKNRLPGSIVMKLKPLIQGMPDLVVFYENKWATLECKADKLSHHQPNQDYYVRMMDKMSFSSFIYPENKDEVLNNLEIFMINTNSHQNPSL